MNGEKLKWWSIVLVIIGSIAIAWGITISIGADATSLEIFTPANKRGDFHITDFYNLVEQNNIDKREAYTSDNVIIVAIDQFDRAQTIEVIHMIAQCQPSAIGLDFAFRDSVAYHDDIVNTIVKDSRIIHATKVVKKNNMYQRENLSFYEKECPSTKIGFVNIDADYAWNVIRTFHPFVMDENGDTIPSMALALAKVANPIRAQKLLERKHEREIIDFVSYKIEVIPASNLYNDDIADIILGKVVLVGDTAYATDMRITPLREPMSGLFIHAYAIQTILSNTYIEEWPKWITWVLALGISFLFVILLQFAKGLNYVGNWLIRISIFVIIILLVYFGCYIFSRYHVYADFTVAIAMLTFSSLAFDISYAVIGVIIWGISKYIIKH